MTGWEKTDELLANCRKALDDRAENRRKQTRKEFFKFKPFSDRQLKVLTWWCPSSPVNERDGIIADGSIRSGKTLCMSLSFVIWAMETFDGQNFALCGKTIGSLRRNVLSSLKMMLRSRGYRVSDRRAENMLVIRRGDTINYFYAFGGKDERSQDLIQGITLAGALFDEVALMPESFVNQATARCSVAGSKWWFNCNPEGPQHWFYKDWIRQSRKKKLLYLHFTMEDNLSLSPEIKARYEGMYSGVFYDRYIRGQWVVAEGLIYSMFRPGFHVVADEPRPYDKYYISCDYGTVNPTSMGLWGRSSGSWYRIREYYFDSRREKSQRTDEEHYAALERLAGGAEIDHVIVDPSAASFIEVIRRHGKFRVEPASNRVLDGIRDVATHLRAGDLFICEGCVDCIREFGLYRWDEKASEDRPLKTDDHSMDDARYFVRAAFAPSRFSFQ